MKPDREAVLIEDFARMACEASGNDHPNRPAYGRINGQLVHSDLAWMLWLDDAEQAPLGNLSATSSLGNLGNLAVTYGGQVHEVR